MWSGPAPEASSHISVQGNARVIRSVIIEPCTHSWLSFEEKVTGNYRKATMTLVLVAMLRYIFNLAFLTTATDSGIHSCCSYCLGFLLPHCPPPARRSCHVDDSYNFNKQKKGKWKQAGKDTSAHSLARLALLPFAVLRPDEASN